MAFEDFKDLNKRTATHKVLPNKVFNIAKNPKYDGYQRRLASIVYKLSERKSSGRAATLANTGVSVWNLQIFQSW